MTIFALSSGPGISGVAIVRISGPKASEVIRLLTGKELPEARRATLRKINNINTSELIDEGIIIWFPGPQSYTGEDMAEIHVHGGKAVILALQREISNIKNCRLAEPGEFTKLAFQNGKINLLKAESIADLISAETEIQRLQALKIMKGKSSEKFNQLREKLLKLLSFIEAKIDFPEEDLPEENLRRIKQDSINVLNDINKILNDQKVGEIIREGFKIAIVGPTNAGKSSLLNNLSNREVAIVSEIAGTTRDVVETHLNIDGYPVIISDTAGIRDSKKTIEKSGINKMFEKLEEVHRIIIVLSPDSIKIDSVNKLTTLINKRSSKEMVIVFNKSDLNESEKGFCIWKDKIPELRKLKSITISCKNNFDNNNMLKKLYKFIYTNLLSVDTNSDDYYFSEVRQIECLKKITENLQMAIKHIEALELSSKFLRDAISELDNLYGKHDHENELEIIFNNFCIGK